MTKCPLCGLIEGSRTRKFASKVERDNVVGFALMCAYQLGREGYVFTLPQCEHLKRWENVVREVNAHALTGELELVRP